MLRCAGKNNKRRCRNKAVYRQNPYMEICRDCFEKMTDWQFKKWHEWVQSDRSKGEPTIWVYDSKKRIKERII